MARLQAASQDKSYQLLTPEIGALVLLDQKQSFSPWWQTA